MDLRSLRLFRDVFELGSFAAAARRHDLDPSWVSRTIAALEVELGFQLFQRTTRRLSPTESGATYHASIRALVDELDDAAELARELSQQPIGTVRIAASTFFGQSALAPLLPGLLELHPALGLELVLADHPVDLVAERVDLAIRFGPRPGEALISEKLFDRRFLVAASPDYLTRRGRPESPNDLARHECVRVGLPHYRERWRFRRPGTDAFVVDVPARVIVSHGGTLVGCAEAGVGPAMLADWSAAASLADGTLVDLFPDWEVTPTDFDTACWLVQPPRNYVPMKVRAVVSHLHEMLGDG